MLAENIDTGEKVALKIMKNSDNKSGIQRKILFQNEVKALQELEHPNILKLKDFSRKEIVKNVYGDNVEVSYISLELAEKGEFFDYISEGEKFSEKTTRFFFHKLINALEYIHNNGYAHRDIKPENMLFDKNFNLKFADFGFSTKMSTSDERRGTFGYMAPEVLARIDHDPKKADIFSIGVILFIMVTKHCPFIRAESTDKYYRHFIKGDLEGFWKLHETSNGETKTFTTEFKDLMSGLLFPIPSKRLSLEEIKNHEWFNLPIATEEEITFEFKLRRKILVGANEPSDQKEENVPETKESDKTTKESSRTASNLDVEMKESNSTPLITSYVDIVDGDILVEAATWYCSSQNYIYTKSKDYYRVNVIVGEGDKKTEIEVNILKRKKDSKRAVEFVLLRGSKELCTIIFNNFRDFLKTHL